MSKQIAIVSAGGHARSVANVVFSLPEYRLVSFFDSPRSYGERIYGVRVAPLPEPVEQIGQSGLECVALGHGNNYKRSESVALLGPSGLELPPLVHPNAYVAYDVSIGPGTVIFPGAIVNVSARIGQGCVVNSGAILEHSTSVGDFSQISPGASIASDVNIGSHVFVGIGASVRGKVTIGDGTVIGGGAMVVDDLDPGVLAVGVPARCVKILEPGWSPI